MGNNPSAHRITITKDDLFITEDVHKRLTEASVAQKRSQTPKQTAETPRPSLPSKPDRDTFSDSLLLEAEELKRMEKEYKTRLDTLEKRDEELFRDAASELSRTVERVERKFSKALAKPQCLVEQDNVIRCIGDTPERLLDCSTIVEKYFQCVLKYKSDVISQKGKGPQP